MSGKIARRMDSEESRAFWESAQQTAAELRDWPEWMKAGIAIQKAVASEVVEQSRETGTRTTNSGLPTTY
jgi:antibiotic biosynthesis monooxygenase (ABM) superfamily enzyme